MRFKMLLLTLMLGVAVNAIAGGSGKGNDPLRRSNLYKQGTPGSYPRNFNAEPSNPTKTTMDPAVSTGYYIVDSDTSSPFHTGITIRKESPSSRILLPIRRNTPLVQTLWTMRMQVLFLSAFRSTLMVSVMTASTYQPMV